MSRPIVLSNGELHVGLNAFGLVHDFFFPYVGQENHSAAKQLRHRIGVWVEDPEKGGEFSWCDDGTWDISLNYHTDVLVGHSLLRNEKLGVVLEFDDFVDSTSNSFMRNIHVINHGPAREIRLFLHQVFVISDSYASDTAQYLPDEKAIMHYKGHRVMIASCAHSDGRAMDAFSIGLFGIEGREGTYRDAEDSQLSGNTIEHGRVDSVMQLNFAVPSASSARATYWIAAATTHRQALATHERIQSEGVLHHLLLTTAYWRRWNQNLTQFAQKLPQKYRTLFVRSGLTLKAHQDKRGAVIASTDTSMLKYWRDSYAYCWPRDGAYVVWPLIRLGYTEEPLKFFAFCRRVMNSQGYLMHKYQADGALGASWHSYLHDGKSELPIQEDETALVVFTFGQFYARHKDVQLLREYYPTMLKPMANFLSTFVDAATGLPHNSYDLWEQKYASSTYTAAVVHAALLEAADMADSLSDTDMAVHWRNAAEDIRRAAQKYYFNEQRGFFYRGLKLGNETIEYDETIDTSSFFGAFMYGLFDPDSAFMKRAYQVMCETLSHPDSPALPRFENDDYLRVDPDSNGNDWYITALWHAQYFIEQGQEDKARVILDWVVDHAHPSGMLSEQVGPSGASVSVSPLAWSHAELLSTLCDFAAKFPKDNP